MPKVAQVRPRGSATLPAGPTLRSDAARNRARVLTIAREQIDAGDLSLQMNAIARLAEVGVGTVYRHFPTRQALLEAVATDSYAQLVDEAKSALATEDAAVGFRNLMQCALELMLADAGLAAVLAAPALECEQTQLLGAELKRLFRQLLSRAHQAGAIGRDVDGDDLRRLLCGVACAVQVGKPGRQIDKRYLGYLLDGLRP
jgi:AcrR family transcriptional regulator